MKHTYLIILSILCTLVLILTGCGANPATTDDPTVYKPTVSAASSAPADAEPKALLNSAASASKLPENVDVDLTTLSSTMVYSEVYNMLTAPDDYIGKVVKMSGMYVVYSNQDDTQYYPAVIISDATACCSQGLEFVLAGDPKFPDDYPETETDVTVVGTFATYDEDGTQYCHLVDAAFETAR